jgi:hypothetical protein
MQLALNQMAAPQYGFYHFDSVYISKIYRNDSVVKIIQGLRKSFVDANGIFLHYLQFIL